MYFHIYDLYDHRFLYEQVSSLPSKILQKSWRCCAHKGVTGKDYSWGNEMTA